MFNQINSADSNYVLLSIHGDAVDDILINLFFSNDLDASTQPPLSFDSSLIAEAPFDMESPCYTNVKQYYAAQHKIKTIMNRVNLSEPNKYNPSTERKILANVLTENIDYNRCASNLYFVGVFLALFVHLSQIV